MIRFIRSVIKFQLPRNRIQQILKCVSIRRVAGRCAEVCVQAFESTDPERHDLLPVLHGAVRDPGCAVLRAHGLSLRDAGDERDVRVFIDCLCPCHLYKGNICRFRNVTISDLAIPDSLCSEKGKGGYECPGHMECRKLDLRPKEEGYYGMFNDFGDLFIRRPS